jgi:HEAT repeat protein
LTPESAAKYNPGNRREKHMRIGLLFTALFLLACGHPPPAARAQADDARRLRDELVRARLEILDLKLKLARLGGKPEEEHRILEEALSSEWAEVAVAGFRELGALPEDRRRQALPLVIGRLASGPEGVRVQAVAFLGRAAAPEAEAALIGAARDPSSLVRRAAASALKSSTADPSLQALVALLGDPDREVRLASVDALGVARREGAVQPLLASLRAEKDVKVQEKTVLALGALGSPAALEALGEALGREPLRWAAIDSMGRIGDPRAAARLRPFLAPPFPLDVRQGAVEALGKMKDGAALPRLAEILRDDPEEKLRQAAAASIGLMASADAIEALLLPAYLDEKETEGVRRAIWAATLAVAGEGFAPNERLVTLLLARGRRAEADQVCTLRIHAVKPEGELREPLTALERRVADALLEARDAKAALGHYRHLALLSPDHAEALHRIVACTRLLKDLDGAARSLREFEAKLPPEIVVDEAHALLSANPPPHPEERRKLLEQALRAAALRLVGPLTGPDEAARKAAREAVLRQGRRILGALASEIEEAPQPSPAVLEAGSAITGLANDPLPPGGAKARAAAWRAWLEAPRPR